MNIISRVVTRSSLSDFFVVILVLEPMLPPRLVTAKNGSIVEIDPPALRFWEKLGLAPRGGRKNVEAWVVYPDSNVVLDLKDERAASSRTSFAKTWLAATQQTYQVCDL